MFQKRNIDELYNHFNTSIKTTQFGLIIGVMLMMLLNWFLESQKWKLVVSKFTTINALSAFQMIVVGLTFGVVTPSRIGEYFGRFYMMETGKKWHSLAATFLGSLAQNIVTGGMGILGALYLLSVNSPIEKYLYSSVIVVLALLLLGGIFLYYYLSDLPIFLKKFSSVGWIRKIILYSNYLKNIETKELHQILLLSLGRYLIYTTQYFILLVFFGIHLSTLESVAVISFLFLLQSGIPLPPLLGVLARGELAITIWSLYTENTLGIVAATLSLWIINLVLPALGGMGVILTKKV
jgi:hypothetical protein